MTVNITTIPAIRQNWHALVDMQVEAVVVDVSVARTTTVVREMVKMA